MLHVAPGEKSLVRRFRAMGDYVAGDMDPELYPGQVDKVDLTRMNYEQPFDVIYASHVLEHISDDRAAMKQMFATLNRVASRWYWSRCAEMLPRTDLT